MNYRHFEQWTHQFDDFHDFKKDLKCQLGRDFEILKPDWEDQFLRTLDYYYKFNIHIIHPKHECYPSAFLNLKDKPLHLSVKTKNLNVLNQHAISCVGSRYPNAAVLQWMDVHITEIAKKGFVIVSGAARGIDQKAHSCALRAEKPTIAFLPSGLSSVYPREFQKWEDSIFQTGGALVSEYNPYQEIMPHHFHERNRMIASLGLITFVAQARKRSGSTLTARLAIENSKTIAVLPSFPGDTMSEGSLDLLFQGAFPIRDSDDLMCLLKVEQEKRRHLYQMSLSV